MRRMFLDAIRGGYEGFQSIGKTAVLCSSLSSQARSEAVYIVGWYAKQRPVGGGDAGFQKWARYRDVWRET